MYRVNIFLDHLKFEKGNSDKTILAYRNDIDKFLKYTNKKIDKITTEYIFIYWIFKRKVSI